MIRRIAGLLSPVIYSGAPSVLQAVDRSPTLCRLIMRLLRYDRRITLAYISQDEADLIAVAHDYYAALGVPIRVFLDDRSTEACFAELRSGGIDFSTVSNTKDYVEPLYEEVSRLVTTEWLFIMTNDELLSPAALLESWFRCTFERGPKCYAISRIWAMELDGRVYAGAASFMGPDYQYRLVKHRTVTFHDQIHTPGFEVPKETKRLSGQAHIVHYDWLLRSLASRQEKLAFYESRLPGASKSYEKWYQPELFLDEFTLSRLPSVSLLHASQNYVRLARA